MNKSNKYGATRAPEDVDKIVNSEERRRRRRIRRRTIAARHMVSLHFPLAAHDTYDPGELVAEIEVQVRSCSPRKCARISVELSAVETEELPAEYTILKNFIVQKVVPRPGIM